MDSPEAKRRKLVEEEEEQQQQQGQQRQGDGEESIKLKVELSNNDSNDDRTKTETREAVDEEEEKVQVDDDDGENDLNDEVDEEVEEPSQFLDAINALVLPDDVLLSIFFFCFASTKEDSNTSTSELQSHHHRQYKRNISLVCRHWSNLINSRSLWISLLREVIDDRHPVPSSTVALQRLVLNYFAQAIRIEEAWDLVVEALVSKFGYDSESITLGDRFTMDRVRELEKRWKIKLPLGFIALLTTPRVLLPSG